MLVRVPEAYLLIPELQTTRPGLLVMDADARRVASIPLEGAQAADVAKALRAARTAPAEERIVLRLLKGEPKQREALRMALAGKAKGVAQLVVKHDGALDPREVFRIAKEHGVEIRYEDPVPVAIEGSIDRKRVPGVRFAESGRAYIARLLLHPDSIGVATDLEVRRYELPDAPTGASGARVASAPLSVEGVLSVFPDLFWDAGTVVGRKGAVDWKRVLAALRATGVDAAEASE